MGRGKIEIKRIENDNSRKVTFTKRRNGLLKKAHELAVLCDAQVAVIGYSSTGKVFDFASSSMEQILSRYNKCLETLGTPKVKHGAQKDANEVAVLKKEFETLQAEQKHVLGKDLTGLGLKELQELELILNEGLLAVNDKTEKILIAQLEESRMKEQMAMLENETLHKQIKELHGYGPISATPISAFHEYKPERERSPVKDGVSSLETVFCAETMTALQLGRTPSPGYRKRKAPEKETADKETGSDTSGSQLEM